MENLDQSSMRVVINRCGGAIPAAEMARQCQAAMAQGEEAVMGISHVAPTLVFIRDDGWMLAASEKFEAIAHEMWEDKWVGFCRFPSTTVQDIADYIPSSF